MKVHMEAEINRNQRIYYKILQKTTHMIYPLIDSTHYLHLNQENGPAVRLLCSIAMMVLIVNKSTAQNDSEKLHLGH